MKMNLKMVTWEGDLTQFLVDAETDEDAIQQAIRANQEIDDCYTWQPDTDENDREHIDNVADVAWYVVDDVDFCMLKAIFGREDCRRIYGNAIVFND